MKKTLLVSAIFAAVAFVGNCSSVAKRDVGGKKIVHVMKTGVHIFGGGGAPVTACIDGLSTEGAKSVIEAGGASQDGLLGITRMLGTVGTETCSAIGY